MQIQPVSDWLRDQRDPRRPNLLLHISGGPGKGALVFVLAQALGKPVCYGTELPMPLGHEWFPAIEDGLLCIEHGGEWPVGLSDLTAALLTGVPIPSATWSDDAARRMLQPRDRVPIVVISHGRSDLLDLGSDVARRTVEFHVDTFHMTPDVTYWRDALGFS